MKVKVTLESCDCGDCCFTTTTLTKPGTYKISCEETNEVKVTVVIEED